MLFHSRKVCSCCCSLALFSKRVAVKIENCGFFRKIGTWRILITAFEGCSGGGKVKSVKEDNIGSFFLIWASVLKVVQKPTVFISLFISGTFCLVSGLSLAGDGQTSSSISWPDPSCCP